MARYWWLSTLWLLGCAQTMDYYRLPLQTTAMVEKTEQKRFALRYFHTPAYLEQEKLVRQSGVVVKASALGQWQSVPREHFKQQLFHELQGLLPSAFVEQYPLHDERQPDFIIDVRLERLIADEQKLYLTAHYTVNPRAPSQTLQREYPLADARDATLVQAHQSALHDLAQSIAQTTARYQPNRQK